MTIQSVFLLLGVAIFSTTFAAQMFEASKDFELKKPLVVPASEASYHYTMIEVDTLASAHEPLFGLIGVMLLDGVFTFSGIEETYLLKLKTENGKRCMPFKGINVVHKCNHEYFALNADFVKLVGIGYCVWWPRKVNLQNLGRLSSIPYRFLQKIIIEMHRMKTILLSVLFFATSIFGQTTNDDFLKKPTDSLDTICIKLNEQQSPRKFSGANDLGLKGKKSSNLVVRFGDRVLMAYKAGANRNKCIGTYDAEDDYFTCMMPNDKGDLVGFEMTSFLYETLKGKPHRADNTVEVFCKVPHVYPNSR
ncbi:hypothetical protein B9Z55_016138 [Caenorhabditis nigoni]|uniref:ZP domain-containing protein n=1 Tax=Caenorhabditis nigoni TaxID=1611254 RepID=A0A2G5UDF0_9PELO|nr:hypothetical protein B9Z55_016138 [Caenorhabditis nigoni]